MAAVRINVGRTFRAGEIADALRVSNVNVGQLTKSGVLTYATDAKGKAITGQYDLVECWQRYYDYKVGANNRATHADKQVLDRAEAEARIAKWQAQADRERIETEMVRGTVVRVQDAKDEIIQMILAVKSALLSLPTRLASRLLMKDDEREIVRTIRDEVEKALCQLSEIDWRNVRDRNAKLRKFVTLQNSLAGNDDAESEPETTLGE